MRVGGVEREEGVVTTMIYKPFSIIGIVAESKNASNNSSVRITDIRINNDPTIVPSLPLISGNRLPSGVEFTGSFGGDWDLSMNQTFYRNTINGAAQPWGDALNTRVAFIVPEQSPALLFFFISVVSLGVCRPRF